MKDQSRRKKRFCSSSRIKLITVKKTPFTTVKYVGLI